MKLPDDSTRAAATAGAPAPAARAVPDDGNPAGIGLLALLVEDLRTYEYQLWEPGLWAILAHRLGKARASVRPRLLRAPLTVAYRAMYLTASWGWGITLGSTVKVGRRVRIWHHGGMLLGAKSIGDDVYIRHNTTLGTLNRDDNSRPVIGDRVDIGTGACVVGGITVGDDAVIGANSVVLQNVPPRCTVIGVPARPVLARAERKPGSTG